VFDLIVLIEELTGRAVPDEEVTLQNLRSIQAITEAFWEEA
jgi:acyl carrier protein